jgi:hypothetical protein
VEAGSIPGISHPSIGKTVAEEVIEMVEVVKDMPVDQHMEEDKDEPGNGEEEVDVTKEIGTTVTN